MNEIIIHNDERGDYVELILTRGKSTFVDWTDYAKVCNSTWSAYESWTKDLWYATATIKQKTAYLHKLITPPDWERVDHRDRNGLNNRQHNLRRSTIAENAFNCKKRGITSKFHGVYYNKIKKCWMARIRHGGKRIYLGVFASEEAAYAARMKAEKLYYPNFERMV